ncbi:SLAP domain-containing protein [Lactobacillus kalixensis]|uniref:Surface layer protein n=1 Tax=Lactobacillus kalixensis DSM 16043 TaxID=1423763 RepID=A0A0R1UEG3_9LACO|nr:SLAP domain-containing protein [Lactobacillus kalixensis]KRL89352.1 surface layer protein [Lactobacillus kalixensis DSM 16043]
MKTKKVALMLSTTLLAFFLVTEEKINLVNAATTDNVFVRGNTILKTIVSKSIIYDKNGNNTGKYYNAYTDVYLENKPVSINGKQYYKVANKNQYINPSNVDGVKRKVTHNTYIYSSSNRRTSFNGAWKLYKGQTVTTYGSSLKFKNGKHYFNIGNSPAAKQYVKSYNLGAIIGSNIDNLPTPTGTGETATAVVNSVSYNKVASIYEFDNHDNAILVKKVPNGTRFTVDRKEYGLRGDAIASASGSFNGLQTIYHIKGTDNWIYGINVKVNKNLPTYFYRG